MNPYHYLFKYIIVGDTSVGKSCLLLKFVDQRFRENHSVTIGVEFGSKIIKVNGKDCKIHVWDTAGQETFNSITRAYYRKAAGALLVYDITKRDSFVNVKEWLEDVKTFGQANISMMLIGNKSDLSTAREVTYEEGELFAKENNMAFLETSAKQNEGVDQAFLDLASTIKEKVEKGKVEAREDYGIKLGDAAAFSVQSSNNKSQANRSTWCNCV